MKIRAMLLSLTIAFLVPALSVAQIGTFTADFEMNDTAAPENGSLAADGWKMFCNVFGSDGSYWYGYGTFDAPNHGEAISAVVEGEGGPAQEMKQLSIFSDYYNADHANGALIETNVFQEITVAAENVGQTWILTFDAKRGNLEGATTAAAFFKTLDPNAGWAMTNYITEDMTDIAADWNGYSIMIDIDDTLVGQIFQFGFTNTASNYEGSGIFYDNVHLSQDGTIATSSTTLDNLKSLYR